MFIGVIFAENSGINSTSVEDSTNFNSLNPLQIISLKILKKIYPIKIQF